MKIKIGLALTSFCFATSWLSTLPQAQAKNSSVELQAASASGQDASWVELNPLERKLVKSPNSEVSLQKLTASFVLANSQVKYELRYFVDNDWEYHGWKDPRQISAPYFAGLGFVKPNSNSWYYNAYINFKLDDFNAGQYAIKSIEEVVMPDGAARVDVLWDTPKADLTLSFVLPTGGLGILQQLTIHAKEPIDQVTIGFSAHPAGFDGGKVFLEADPSMSEWVVLGREDNEVDEKNIGLPSALLILSDEWDLSGTGTIITNGRLVPLTKAVNLQPGDEVKVHWALWTFEHFSNTQAVQYMSENAEATRKQLGKIFP